MDRTTEDALPLDALLVGVLNRRADSTASIAHHCFEAQSACWQRLSIFLRLPREGLHSKLACA